jgi:hypothetical protein
MHRCFGRITEGSRPLERSKHVWENNIILHCKEIFWKGVEWGQSLVAGWCEHGN